MKTILGLSLCLFAFSAHSAPAADTSAAYEVKLELAVDGKHVASPKLTVNSDQKAVIRQKADDGTTYVVEVLLHPEAGKKMVTMDFTVSSEGADGKSDVLATPHVTAKERKGATVTVNKNDGSEKMSLKVWAKRITAKK